MQEEPGFKKLTMEDVARELGVSKTTVSRSVSGKGRIGKKTRQRVLDYIAQHSAKTAEAESEDTAAKTAADSIPDDPADSAADDPADSTAGEQEKSASDGPANAVSNSTAGEQAKGAANMTASNSASDEPAKTTAAAISDEPAKTTAAVSDELAGITAAVTANGTAGAAFQNTADMPDAAASKSIAAKNTASKSTANKPSRRKQTKKGTGNIGVVLPADLFASDRPYFPKALKGISEIADSEDYDVIMILVDTNDLSRLSRVIEKRKADGLILIRTLQDEKPMEMLKTSDIPFAAVGESDDPQVYQADNDYTEACFELTNILLMKGVKKIAAVAGNMSYMINQKRMEGFYRAHKERGVTPDRSLIFTDIVSALAAAKAADTAAMRGASCIIGADDLITSQVLRELEDQHIRIPEDMKLASFHDSQLLASAKTGITAIQFHTEELGREACRMLLHQIRGEEVPRRTKLSYEVTLRESTK